ncbi:protein SCARECROW-like isoform X2 [Prosopis cineraria]|uniref:protein SCARECROW-like isoform X2 n=1 Tax=Prosopis cineraria TaxID=364024 RepID=UPI00240F44A7|nr:protein SCARECROW-like isoform X2 [Prosopis cineraria]
MMKVGFKVIHGDCFNMIRPHVHESWDYPNNNVGLSSSAATSSSSSILIPFSKPPAIDTTTNSTVNLATNEFSDWVEHITKHLVDDLPAAETTSDHNLLHPYNHCQTGSTSHDNLVPTPVVSPVLYPRNKGPFNNDDLQIQIQTQTNPSSVDHDQSNDVLHLLTLLMECAVAISVDNLSEAHRMLVELTQLASPYKPSCGERIVAYFAKAMTSRVMNSWLGVFSPLIDHRSIHSSLQVFNNISPFIKFAHFTSNQAILEAVHCCDSIHIIDLDIMQGLQWPAFFHILANRMEGRPRLRMTGMGASMDILVETGKQLTNFAKRLGMSFHFQPIARKFGEIEDVSKVQVRPGETIAVHWLQHSLYDATGPDWKTLRLLEELEPRIITLVEQDVSSGGSFLDRFVGSLHYYSTVFDSLGAYMASEDLNRHKVEHGLLSREINNILAIGGPARSGEDKCRQWRSELARIGFLQVPMSPNSMAQAQLILNMFSPPHHVHGYTLAQVDGTLRLGWKNTGLYTASAWTCYNSTNNKH